MLLGKLHLSYANSFLIFESKIDVINIRLKSFSAQHNVHLLYLKLFSYPIFRIQIKVVISLIMICHMIVLHQSTALFKKEEDEGKEQDVCIIVRCNFEILSCTQYC